MNNEPVAWKAYDEVSFSNQYNLRWVREGDEYVNRITKEMMEDLQAVVRQQQAEIGFYKQDADKYKQKCASQQAEIEALKRHRNKLETLAEKMLQGSGEEDEQ